MPRRPDPTAPPRSACLWCADWSAVAAVPATVPSGPLAVVRSERVLARTPMAARAGVVVGQRRRDAQRACPDLVLVPHDPDRDARAFEPLVRAVAALAPLLEVVEPGWLLVPTRGPSRYLGGDAALADRLLGLTRTVLDDAGSTDPVRLGVGVADGRAAATIVARRSVDGPPTVIPPGGSADALAPRSVRWLTEVGDAPPDLVQVLVRLGIRDLGALAALPAPDVLARFGTPGLHAHRLASGRDPRPPEVTEPSPDRCIEQVFTEPVLHVTPVAFAAKHLADQLVDTLAGEGRVCTRVVVVLETEHGERSERAWYRDAGLTAAAMVERVRWQLDGWLSDGGPTAGVVLLRLAPTEVRADDGEQIRLWGGRSRADDDAQRAVTRLIGLAGPDAVTVPERVGGRLHADRVRWTPAATTDLDVADRRRSDGPWIGALPAPSPATVAVDPVEVSLVDVAGDPVLVGGRGEISAAPATLVIDGRPHEVSAWAGPWPVDQVWWDADRHRRLARVQLVTTDGTAWLVACEHRRWWWLATYT